MIRALSLAPDEHKIRQAERSSRLPLVEETLDSESLASVLATTVLEKKARDLAILDMSNLVDYADAFVICTATNRRQVQAVADEVRRVAKRDLGLIANSVEGMEAARWVLVDFGSVVVHVFDEPMRAFYNLDGLWSDAPRMPSPEGQRVEVEPAFPIS